MSDEVKRVQRNGRPAYKADPDARAVPYEAGDEASRRRAKRLAKARARRAQRERKARERRDR